MVNLIMCVGVSSYQVRRDDGVEEATDAALEELTNLVALRITDGRFQGGVLPRYKDARSGALAALETIIDRDSAEYAKALEAARAARKRVVASLRRSGGVAVPLRHADWYWEEYAARDGGNGTEFLVFVRYDVSLDMLRSLVQRYSVPTDVLGAPAIPYFPSLAWSAPDVSAGAMLLAVPPALARARLAKGDVITAVAGTAVEDPADLGQRLGQQPKHGSVALTVKHDHGPPRAVEWKVE
jgi:hypothetical protein